MSKRYSIQVDDLTFKTYKECAAHFGINPQVARRRCQSTAKKWATWTATPITVTEAPYGLWKMTNLINQKVYYFVSRYPNRIKSVIYGYYSKNVNQLAKDRKIYTNASDWALEKIEESSSRIKIYIARDYYMALALDRGIGLYNDLKRLPKLIETYSGKLHLGYASVCKELDIVRTSVQRRIQRGHESVKVVTPQ